ncbi:MAG: hypothetical protein HRU36_05260 [Rickettsiales bacterium]|nr:hypothetical protein [Rickettsiales bacterium]
MVVETKIITRNEESRDALNWLFNSNNNPTFCSYYGNGNHCDNPERVEKKLNLWGLRGEENSENDCTVSRVLYFNNEDTPATLFNIGFSGNPPTIIDRINSTDGGVYEFSPIFISEEYLSQIIPIAVSINDILHSCNALDSYSKTFVSFNPNAPYQKELFHAIGGSFLHEDNYYSLLGQNSLHPARFKFDEEGQLNECIKWNQNIEPLEYEGWHDSNPCIEWVPKDALVFDIAGGHIDPHAEL